MGKPPVGSNPQAAVPGSKQRKDTNGPELLSVGRRPGNKSDAIEAEQSTFCSHPQVSIGGLRDGCWRPAEESVLRSPCGVRILRDVFCRR